MTLARLRRVVPLTGCGALGSLSLGRGTVPIVAISVEQAATKMRGRLIWGMLTLTATLALARIGPTRAAGMDLSEARLWGTMRAV